MRTTLLSVPRDDLGLTATRYGCGVYARAIRAVQRAAGAAS